MLILLYLLQMINCQRVAHPSNNITDVKLQNEDHRLLINQEIVLYENFSNAIQIMIYRKDRMPNHVPTFTEQDFKQLEEEQSKLEGRSGCISKQKSIQTKQFYRMTLPSNSTVYYTDLLVLQNRALIIRNDLILNEIYIGEQSEQSEKSEQSEQSEESISQSLILTKGHVQKQLPLQYIGTPIHPHFLHDRKQKRVFIISEAGGVSFSDSMPLSSLHIVKEQFATRKIVYNVFMKDKIYVACGLQGLDIYSNKLGNLIHQENILSIHHYRLNVVDISGDDDNLYILDYEVGLIVCDHELNFKFLIDVQSASDFDHYNNTFFIVGQSINRQDYAIEIFVDTKAQQFYINRYFIDEMSFYDVKVFQDYALLIGYNAHKLLYHSVNYEFTYSALQVQNYYAQSSLMQIQSWNNYTLALGKKDLKIIHIQPQPCSVTCSSTKSIQQIYQAYIYEKGATQYDLIRNHHAFYLTVKDNTLLNKENIILAVIAFILLFLLVWIAVVTTLCCIKYQKSLAKKQDETTILTQQAKLDSDNGPGQELTSI